MKSSEMHLPLSKAIFIIAASTVLISGSSWIAFIVYKKFFDARVQDPHYQIAAIVQTGPEKEALKTAYLAELLDLSADSPKNLYQLNIVESQKELLSSPLIKSASLKRIPPGTLYIDYSIRHPLAFLGDYSNTAIDEEGILFPFRPFFSPKNLPEIYLGISQESSLKWGDSLYGDRFELALEVVNEAARAAQAQKCDLLRADVSQAYAKSFGQRQIVLTLGTNTRKKIFLRLPVKGYKTRLKDFQSLDLTMQEIAESNSAAIDLRIPKLAFIKKIE